MRTTYTLCIYLAISLMTGCGRSDNTNNDSAQDAPPPVSHTVFAPYIREIDKAKNVQNTVDAQKQSLDKQIRAQTGASDAAPAATQPPL